MRLIPLTLCLTATLLCGSQAFAQNPFPSAASHDPEGRYRGLETFARALYYLETMYVEPGKAKPEVMIRDAIDGIVARLDPHTVLLAPEAFKQLTSDTKGEFGGIGIMVTREKDRLIIVSPVAGTPAMRAGILAGDEIIAIDGREIARITDATAVDLLKGPAGSKITLRIQRVGAKDPLEFTLTREIIKTDSVSGQHLSSGVFSIRISNFQEDTRDELFRRLKDYERDMKGLILDLRGNPGGLLEQSVKVADLFISSGLIVSTVSRDRDRIERDFAQAGRTFQGFPMIVLVNDGTASAAEIVAGALQDHQRALVLGTPTFGKGSVQTLVSLPDGSGLKLTIARYYTPRDRSIQARGITPDIIVARTHRPLTKRPGKKESDLKGHIEAQDLSDLSLRGGILNSLKSWPKEQREDHQLITAYTYLRGWGFFGNQTPREPSPKS